MAMTMDALLMRQNVCQPTEKSSKLNIEYWNRREKELVCGVGMRQRKKRKKQKQNQIKLNSTSADVIEVISRIRSVHCTLYIT